MTPPTVQFIPASGPLVDTFGTIIAVGNGQSYSTNLSFPGFSPISVMWRYSYNFGLIFGTQAERDNFTATFSTSVVSTITTTIKTETVTTDAGWYWQNWTFNNTYRCYVVGNWTPGFATLDYGSNRGGSVGDFCSVTFNR